MPPIVAILGWVKLKWFLRRERVSRKEPDVDAIWRAYRGFLNASLGRRTDGHYDSVEFCPSPAGEYCPEGEFTIGMDRYIGLRSNGEYEGDQAVVMIELSTPLTPALAAAKDYFQNDHAESAPEFLGLVEKSDAMRLVRLHTGPWSLCVAPDRV